ncbi:MAG: SUMF1/EgtB/PvdO family nonheme iron enzyme [Planctomycetota bacterium]|nr:SUMF1/EgtB/PvdO family nonheme iron enzyme [Planctomycetota bacterium]
MSLRTRFALGLLLAPAAAFAQPTDPGSSYCTAGVNSTGVGALMSASGTADVPLNDLVLQAEFLPPNRVGLFFQGAGQTSRPMGNGTLCVAPGDVGMFRLGAILPTGSGAMSLAVDYEAQTVPEARITAGSTWYFQAWYRDPNAGGANFNLTDGYEIRFHCGGGGGLYEGMSLIPAGWFRMGDHHDAGMGNEDPLHSVLLSAFLMDVFEVTNGEYATFLNCALARGEVTKEAGGVWQVSGAQESLCHTNDSSDSSHIAWDAASTTFSAMSGWEDQPLVEVSWYGACLYANSLSKAHGLNPSYDETSWECDFDTDGYRLPTEAEWEYAARGGSSASPSMFPWGNSINGSQANYAGSGDPFEGSLPATTPVGYFDGNQSPAGADMANGYGLYDMNGNVSELCGDWYEFSYYSNSPIFNPTGPVTGTGRVVRGGGFDDATPMMYLRSAYRIWAHPHYRHAALGFRLVAGRP